MFLSFPCAPEVNLRCWNFLEGYISQGEANLTDICQVQGVRPFQTSAFQHFSALPPTMGPFQHFRLLGRVIVSKWGFNTKTQVLAPHNSPSKF